uniref:Uncharacterized protein n=1 Tax=Anopheles epiroticus TaxID=199890 RepID=A0A182PYT9_9DIPT
MQQDASCEIVEPQQQQAAASSTSPSRHISAVEDASKRDRPGSASDTSPERRVSVVGDKKGGPTTPPAILPHDLEVRRKRLTLRRKLLEMESARKELELELEELELAEEISDRSSQVSAFVGRTEAWLRETDAIGTDRAPRRVGDQVGHSPLTPAGKELGSTGMSLLAAAATPSLLPVATAAPLPPPPLPPRDAGTMASAPRGRFPSSPETTGHPPDYDRTWAADQAAAMEREYAEWRRAVENSIQDHRAKHVGQSHRPGAMAAASAAPYNGNSTVTPAPAAPYTPLLTMRQKEAREITPKELPIFSGTVEQWPLFITAYERSTAACGFSDEENLIRLQRALRGPALESVDHLLLLPDGLVEAIDILRTEYGRPDLIVDSLVEKVRRLPPIRADRLETLANFGKAVRKMCATIKASGLEDYDCNVTLLKELVAKLPAERRLEWARYKVKLAKQTVGAFGIWFTEIAVAVPASSGVY